MKNYAIWNRTDKINGVEPKHFLDNKPFKDYEGDIILIFADNGKVSNVECKDILATVYDIDVTLELDEFMAEYFAKTEEKEPLQED